MAFSGWLAIVALHLWPRRQMCLVYLVDGFSVEICSYVFHADVYQTLSGFVCGPCNVRRDVAVLSMKQRIVLFGWFYGEHVCAIGRNDIVVESVSKRIVVYQRSSACIDENGIRLHCGQALAVDEVVCLVVKRAVQRDDVACLEDSVHIHFLDAVR